MDHQTNEDPPPCSTDLEGWRQAVTDGRFRDFKMEAIIAAIQDLGPNTDTSVLNPLVLHASDTITRILRRRVTKDHRNEGKDIISDVHGQLVQAIFEPESADGAGLREAFVPRVQFRAVDAIRNEQKKERREHATDLEHSQLVARQSQKIDPWPEVEGQLDVELVLSHVTDERKRLAFRLYMEGIPLESKKTDSIAKALEVSSKTAGQWIEEVRAQLRNIVGEKS
jgi:RNA polymerase sigma factor (sigma-70 family)